MTPETTQAVAELAEAMDMTEDEVLEKAVRLLAVHRLLIWTPAPMSNTRESE